MRLKKTRRVTSSMKSLGIYAFPASGGRGRQGILIKNKKVPLLAQNLSLPRIGVEHTECKQTKAARAELSRKKKLSFPGKLCPGCLGWFTFCVQMLSPTPTLGGGRFSADGHPMGAGG